MTAYDVAAWTDFANTVAGGAAPLAGLLFVGLSLNLSEMLKYPGVAHTERNTPRTYGRDPAYRTRIHHLAYRNSPASVEPQLARRVPPDLGDLLGFGDSPGHDHHQRRQRQLEHKHRDVKQMRWAVEQDREEPPDPACEERGGQQFDVDAFVLHVACAPQQRYPVAQKQSGEEPVARGPSSDSPQRRR